MNNTLDIIFGESGRSLYFDADEKVQPSSPTITVHENAEEDDELETALDGGASVSAVDTTFDQLSGYAQDDPRVCYVASTSNVAIGERYLCTNDNGETEIGEVIEIDTDVSVTFRHPMQNTYQAGGSSTFQGLRISVSLLDSWTSDETNISDLLDPNPRYRFRVEYTAGVKVVRPAYFDLVRYTRMHSVVGLDVDQIFPGFLNSLPPEYREDRGQSLIVGAYFEVKLDLYADRKADQMARNLEAVNSLTIHKSNFQAQFARFQRGGVALEVVEAAETLYEKRYNQLIRQAVIPFDQTGDGGGSRAPRVPIFRR